jgi:transcriptional regulator with XRE-family HTH domain
MAYDSMSRIYYMKQSAVNRSPDEPGADGAEQLGARLRALRGRRGLTLDALAERSGVSKAMLSKIERGATNPTVNIASRVARGLGVSLAELAGVEERRPALVVPAARRLPFEDPETRVTRHIFPALAGGALEFLHLTLPPGTDTGDLPQHRSGSETYIVVDRGQLQAYVGDEHFVLGEEDVLYFGGDVAHRFANTGADECHCFVIGTRGET